MVRLVFRRYTQIRRSICTSESLRASTSVSAGFTLFRHSSPSFGSQQIRSYSNLSESRIGRSMMPRAPKRTLLTSIVWTIFTFIVPTGFDHPETRAHVRLLGPCFKTGRMEPYGRQHPRRVVCEHLAIDRQQFERTGVPSATVDMPNRSQESPARHASQSHGRRRAIRARGLTTGVEAGSPSSCPFRPSATDADARSPEVRSPRIASAHASSMRIESAHVAKREQLNLAGRIANSIRFPFNGFTYFLTLFQSPFHLSLTVLVRYRSRAYI